MPRQAPGCGAPIKAGRHMNIVRAPKLIRLCTGCLSCRYVLLRPSRSSNAVPDGPFLVRMTTLQIVKSESSLPETVRNAVPWLYAGETATSISEMPSLTYRFISSPNDDAEGQPSGSALR